MANQCLYGLLRKTPLQLQTLEILYSDDKNPTQSRLEDYASGLGLTFEQAKRWFVERRRRDLHTRVPVVNESVKSASKRKSLEAREHENCRSRAYTVQDMLHSPDYIFQKVFRKDGPPLGAEFDPLPEAAFQSSNKISDSRCEVVCEGEQRALNRRKVTKPAIIGSERCTQVEAPVKKHGKGKGLMSVWQMLNSHACFKDTSGALKRGKMLPSKHTYQVKKHGMGKGFMNTMQMANQNFKRKQRRKPTIPRRPKDKVRDKTAPLALQRKVESSRNSGQKAHRDSCKIALDVSACDKDLCSSLALEDDEELELRELQAGPNPLTCGAHIATGGSHGCSLCKGLLQKFPPDSVRMKKPLSMHPWNSFLELEKNFFKVFHFLYTYGVILELCPFSLDEFAMAFHDKDSLLLGKLHLSLLGHLLSDIQKEISNGLSYHSNRNGRFLSLLHKAETENLVNFWKNSLNPLTWAEILRQVVVASGFGSEDDIQIKGCHPKEADHITKHGLHPGTLKGELFSILFEQGNKGMKISELSKSSRIVNLNPGQTNGELEDSICSILAGDITLFEKISSSAYRIRLTIFNSKDDEDVWEDSGCIDDDSRVSSNVECDSSNSSSRHERRHQSPENNPLGLSSIIDESTPGESWLLGLMEGEYSDLSIGEKLNALLALVDLVSAGASIRFEDPSTAVAECVPWIYQHGSGGKIKRSATRRPSLLTSSYNDIGNWGVEDKHPFSEIDPVDSSVVLSMMSEKTGKEKSSNGAGQGDYLHPIQSIFLGSDRRYNRYWLFVGPCDAIDPGHKRVYFESSEDGQWQVIDSEEALCGLLASLNDQGRREANLLASLEKRMPFLLEELSSWVSVDTSVSQSTQSGLSDVDRFSEDSPSSISDTDNLSLGKNSCNAVKSSTSVPLKGANKVDVQKQKYERLQAFDSWIWDGFYINLHAVKQGKHSFFDSWTRCGSCHDLYWRDERHCKICHTTFELDLDLEEKYAIHLASCQGPEDGDVCPVHKVLPSKLQALKAAVHVIELIMPEDAMIGAWKKSARKLWVRRLKRTSSLHELSQVLADYVGSFNVEWMSQCNMTLKHESPVEDFVTHFQNMPQSSSAVALWLVILDSLIALQLDEGVLVGTAKGQKPAALPVISVDEH